MQSSKVKFKNCSSRLKTILEAEYLIVLEDDLSVSADFFIYFNWALDLFKIDPSLYCVSAWNDHGMNHAVASETVFNRVEYMPGLGWAMSREIINQLLPIWLPKERQTDWDLFLRKPSTRKGELSFINFVLKVTLN